LFEVHPLWTVLVRGARTLGVRAGRGAHVAGDPSPARHEHQGSQRRHWHEMAQGCPLNTVFEPSHVIGPELTQAAFPPGRFRLALQAASYHRPILANFAPGTGLPGAARTAAAGPGSRLW